jgi:hypothetical protein
MGTETLMKAVVERSYLHFITRTSEKDRLLSRSQMLLLKNFQYFMEPNGSILCSQEPATGPYLEPDESSPYHSILFLLNPS